MKKKILCFLFVVLIIVDIIFIWSTQIYAKQTDIIINGTLYPQTSDTSKSSDINNSSHPVDTSANEIAVTVSNGKLPQMGATKNVLPICGGLLILVVIFITTYRYITKSYKELG